MRTTSSNRHNVASGRQVDTGGAAEPVGDDIRFHLPTAPAPA
ncbi:hypothetical protein XOCgx_2960 [Xanthomonas oryzae pv. oryzicola]|uniref:Uncharacterized protein n=1 Tax=Xanthomonas oryzae pv. oryzae (strain PXO99A) TaxID=360094 RepID=A0A0K0GK65_XANOP|nr:hypothetical protein PXO_00523 [Xanthomonas oryzae pv. oryzae PXO99A]QEO97949.1 hypothetical protein XOCgx_2960 [Xanthomonas oryzae pv. oryzicola]